MLCKGLRNSEIGAHPGLSHRTIKWYVRQLFLIFDVTNRTELVGLACTMIFQENSDALTRPVARVAP
jgi:DNA-binding NarL/FixJ family response regulator